MSRKARQLLQEYAEQILAKPCPECGQPMKPKGIKKLPNEYDHAQGCPKRAEPRED